MYVYWNYFENYVFLALIIEVRVRLNSNQTRTRMISGNRTRGSTRAITTNHSRTHLITISNRAQTARNLRAISSKIAKMA